MKSGTSLWNLFSRKPPKSDITRFARRTGMIPQPSNTRIAQDDRIPVLQKFAFASGVILGNTVNGLIINSLWMPVFNIGFGISPVVLGGILMFMRIWDAMTDPIGGNISDNIRTPWGRRRPLIFIGTITTALISPLFFNLPDGLLEGATFFSRIPEWLPFIGNLGVADKAMAVYLTCIGLLFFSCFTLWSMPYYSLQLELTPNYDERTRLTAWMAMFGKIMGLVMPWGLALAIGIGMLAKAEPGFLESKTAWLRDMFSSVQPWVISVTKPQPDEAPIVIGVRLMSWFIAGGLLIFGLPTALFVKERYYKKRTINQKRDPFWASIKESIQCGPLWKLIGIDFFLLMGLTSVTTLGNYVNFYYVFGGNLAAASVVTGIRGSVLACAGIVMIPVYTWLGEKFDKRSMVVAMIGICILGHLSNFLMMTPEYPYLQIVSAIFESAAISAVFLFLPSMKADVADWDELHTSRRREGSLNAFFSWFVKAALTLSMGLSGLLIQFSGFTAGLSSQPEEVSRRMFYIYLFFPICFWVISLVAAWHYPLTRSRCQKIRSELEARRGTI